MKRSRTELCNICHDEALICLIEAFSQANIIDRIKHCVMYLFNKRYIEDRLIEKR